ncbi:putative nardilysin [Rosa chinensis]|uniref:Putative nardilysin n=1 Tax=Rosa chinensis TaxID=74649 RepID=A0A2P6QKS5_ROSCH|nr:putative nardilysin [Rosa chinensis]
MARRTFSSDDVVLKSPNDRRLYRLINLENGLTALLVHDPEIGDSQLSKGSEEAEMEEEEEEEGMEEDEKDDDEEDEDSEGEDEEMDEDDEGEDEDGLKKKKGGDSQTKKAAAAMCVGIGSFSDPPEAPGLAHFLEHMLFMGSTEFPDENELLVQAWRVFKCIHGSRAYLLPF